MATKIIIIREDVYRMLVSLKRNNESFSTLFERLAKSRSNIDKLKELRGFVEIDDKEMLLKEMSEKRKEIIGFESETNSNKAWNDLMLASEDISEKYIEISAVDEIRSQREKSW